MSSRSRFAALLLPLAAVTAALAQEVAVGGRVVLPGGDPLPEAEVVLLPLLDPVDEVLTDLEAREIDPVARALTGPDGRYLVLAPKSGLYRIRVRVAGFVHLEAGLVPLIEPRELPDAELSPDEGLTVKITDAQGRPVPGAAVAVTTDRMPWSLGQRLWSLADRRGKSAADGSVRLARAKGERTVVSVLAPGHAYEERSGVSGTSAKLRLEAGSRIEIAVTDGDGQAVPGALVLIAELPLTRTDERGRAVLHVDPKKPRPIGVLAQDGRSVATHIDAEAAKDEPQRLALPDRLAVSGRVIDARTRKAVAGALIWDQQEPSNAVEADRSGGFALFGPALRELQITAGATGYREAEARPFQLTGDGRAGPTLVLEPAAAIEGVVVDAAGAPLAGVEVEQHARQTPGMFRIEIGGRGRDVPRAITNARGRFRLAPVDPDGEFDVKARAEGFAPASVVVRDLEPYRTKSDVRIELVRGEVITGRVVDREERPIREARVELGEARAAGHAGMMAMAPGHREEPLAGESDGDGRFEIRGVAAGRYDLAASRSGYAATTVPGVEVEAKGEPVNVGDIVLEPGERLAGFVTDTDGQAIEAAEIFVRESGGPMMMMAMLPGAVEDDEPAAMSDPGGYFQLGDLKKETAFEISVRRRGFVEQSLSAIQVPRVEPLQVVLEPASKVSGLVLDPEGEPVAGAKVNMSRSTTISLGEMSMATIMMMSDQADASGRYVFEDQRPGTISLAAVAPGWKEAKRQDLEIPKGEDLAVDLPLERGSIVEGQVFTPDGRPAIDARVVGVGDGARSMARFENGASTDGNGYFRLEGLEPGPVSIEATHDDYPRVVRDVELREGIEHLDLHFSGGIEVGGVVLDTRGGPVPGAAVRLVPSGEYFGGPETRTKGDGTFAMPGVQNGSYTLWAEAEGFASLRDERTVEVAGQPISGLEIRLDPGATVAGRVIGLAADDLRKVSVSARGEMFFGPEPAGVDTEGRFRIEHLSAGEYTIVGTVAGSGRQARHKVTIEPGASETTVDLQFVGGLTLSGRAVQGERAIAGAVVFTQGLDVEHSGWNETDPDGEFSIEGLQPGKYEVQLQEWRSGLSFTEEIELSASREIVLEVPTAQIRGRIVDSADRQPLPGVAVRLDGTEPAGESWRSGRTTTTDMDGRFILDAVGDGEWKLAASKRGYAATTRPVTVRYERALEELHIALDPTEGLVLEARLPSGGVPEEVQVAVLEAGGGTLTRGAFATGENGKVRLSSVPPGSWDLLVAASGSATTRVVAQAPGPVLAVRLEPPCTLAVSIPELRGGETPATVSLSDADGRPFRSLGWMGTLRGEWLATGGVVEIRDLPAGSWTVRAVATDGRRWSASATTSPGPTAEVALQ